MRWMRVRLVIITELIAPYRIPVFNALAQIEGIDLHVIFLAESDPLMRDWIVYKNEICFPYQVLPSYRQRWGKHNLLFNFGMTAALRKLSPDVMLCGGYNYAASWRALAWSRNRGIQFMLWTESHARDSRQNRWLTELLKRIFIGKCHGFVVPGMASREYLLSFNISDSKIFVAPNAVDNKLFGEAAKHTRDDAGNWRTKLGLPSRFFLFVGRLIREKGIFDLLNAYSALSAEIRAEIGLVFVGDGTARAEAEQLIRHLSPASIQFSGFIHRDLLPRYYALAEAFIFPTHSDPWGLVVNEAMACGLAAVSSDVAGCVPDLVEEGWNGYIVSPGDAKKLTQILERMARTPEINRWMGANSRKRIESNSPELCASGIAAAAMSCART